MRGPNQLARLREILKVFIVTFRKNSKYKLDIKVVLFRTLVDVFNSFTAILKYHDFNNDTERQEIILKNLYVFLSLIPLIVVETK